MSPLTSGYLDAVASSTTHAPAQRGVTRSTIGLKIMMAVSGIVFVLYVLLHMYGNLKVLAGQQAFDEYAHHLRTFGEPMLPYGGLLWLVRVVLVVALVAHAYSAFALWKRASAARPQRYAVRKAVSSSLASRTMRWGGVALLLFVVFHLIHFTLVKPNFNSSVDAAAIKDSPFVMVSASFSLLWVVAIYTLAMIALGMHLFHGVWSAQQTLGLTSSVAARARAKTIAAVLAALVVVGFLIPPFYLYFTNL